MSATIDYNDAAVFAHVVTDRSFTAAAARLGLPKSTVSRHVTRLEASLGVRLLERTTRTLRLTAAGTAYFDRVTAALAEMRDAADAVASMQEAPSGHLRITAPVDFAEGLIVDVVAKFIAKHPEIHVEVSLTGRRVDLIAEGFDLAIRAGELGDSSLVARKLGEVERRLFASRAYVDRRGAPAALRDLAAHDCVLFRSQTGRARWTLDGPRGQESVEVKGPVSADELAFVRGVVLAGAGITFAPWPLFADDLASGRVVELLPKYGAHDGHVHIVYPSARHLPRKVSVFRDFVIASFTPSPWARPKPRRAR